MKPLIYFSNSRGLIGGQPSPIPTDATRGPLPLLYLSIYLSIYLCQSSANLNNIHTGISSVVGGDGGPGGVGGTGGPPPAY